MNRTRLRWAFALVLVAVGLAQVIRGADLSPGPDAGRKKIDFTLPDHLGAKRSLAEWDDKPIVVVVFLGTECPLAKLYGRRLAEMDAEYGPKGVQIVGVDANQQDTLQEIAGYIKKHEISFPVLKDAGAKVADELGATRTPEAVVLDRDRIIRYRGRIDDQYGVGASRNAARNSDLKYALDLLLQGRPVANAFVPAVGCLIGRSEAWGKTGEVTYSKDVAPVLAKRCVACHSAGQVAPFTLTSYDDVVAWSDTIQEVIDAGRMPPWHADPEFGEFRNDCRMPEAEKELFRKWTSIGLPAGDLAAAPPAPQASEGWQIPDPRVVFEMPEEYDVPASGTVDYQYFHFDPHFTEDKWVWAAEARPGNREVVHHLIMFYLPPGQEEPEPLDPLVRAVAAFAPGMPPLAGSEEYAVKIPAGSTLWFQMHYTPNGRPQKDKSSAAVVFADPKKVARQVFVVAAFNPKFLIPPMLPDYPISADQRLGEDSLLFTLTPHMHYRGKSFKITARYPQGEREVLLNVPRYDFNWQNVYMLRKAKLLPAGTTLELEAHYDNSANNPLNPDPMQAVHWGDQTWDEMMLGSATVARSDEDLRVGPPRIEVAGPPAVDGTQKYRATFRYRPPDVDKNLPAKIDTVHLAGTFNDWNKEKQPLSGPDADGFYSTSLELPAGRCEYKFVLNGWQWKADPGVAERTREYGNSILKVGETPTQN